VNSNGVVISQVFGGGGNSGAPLRNDFIELFNAGTSQVNLSGWSVQYASATASTWSVTPLTAITLAAGQYYLIQETSGGTNGSTLPMPDATGSISLAATSGKLALVRSTAALSGTCPSDSNIVDFVGYGTTANCFEGSAAAPVPSNTMAIARGNNGCIDTAHNSLDFTLSAPTPRNTSSPFHVCSIASNSSHLIDDLWLWFLLSVVVLAG
jgi:predicted extracellular nuclease